MYIICRSKQKISTKLRLCTCTSAEANRKYQKKQNKPPPPTHTHTHSHKHTTIDHIDIPKINSIYTCAFGFQQFPYQISPKNSFQGSQQ